MSDVVLVRRIGQGFIWIGTVTCGIHLMLTLPGVGSVSGLLLTIADTINRLAGTVGLGAVLFALAQIVQALRHPATSRDHEGIQTNV